MTPDVDVKQFRRVLDALDADLPPALEVAEALADATGRSTDHAQAEVYDAIDAGEQIVDVDDAEGGTVVIKKVPCGKDCGGCPHGPYKYVVRRERDSLEWEYKGPAEGSEEGVADT